MITEEEKKKIRSQALRTWDTIGADYLRILEDNGDMPIILRDEVIEVVLDANRLELDIKDKVLRDKFVKLTYEEQIKLITPVFKAERYGW